MQICIYINYFRVVKIPRCKKHKQRRKLIMAFFLSKGYREQRAKEKENERLEEKRENPNIVTGIQGRYRILLMN